MTRTKNGLPKHCTWNVDRYGKRRVRFRRRGVSVYLNGIPWSADFMRQYAAALDAPALTLSALPGGVAARRGRDPNTVQPLVGVYLLLLKGQIVYVGESLNMPKRVAAHRANGRPFDQVFYIATKANQRIVLERVLIKTINPPQNRKRQFPEFQITFLSPGDADHANDATGAAR